MHILKLKEHPPEEDNRTIYVNTDEIMSFTFLKSQQTRIQLKYNICIYIDGDITKQLATVLSNKDNGSISNINV